MESNTQEEPKPSKNERVKHPFWTGRVLLGIILFLLSILVIIHLPPVQQWGIKKITTSIEKTLETRATIGGFVLNPISDLTLRNVFIGSPGHPEDTLIYAERLSVDYQHIWDLFKNHFTINQVGIKNATLNIHKLQADTLTNLDIALSKLMPPRDTTKPAFVLDLHQVNANHLLVIMDDESNGTLVRLFLNRADVALDTLDITNNYIDIKNLDLDEPRISVINRPMVIDSHRMVAKVSKTWNIDLDRWDLNDGKISIENMSKQRMVYKDPIGIDYSHLLLEDLDLSVDSLQVRGWSFTGKNLDIHALHGNGFEINHLSASRAQISREGVILDDLGISTEKSEIHNSLSLLFTGFTDFKTFTDSVRIVIPAANLNVHMHDLLAIAPGLQNLDFFFLNSDKDIHLQGNVDGHVNRLKILKMNASMGGVRLVGDFRSHDLAVKGSQLLSLDVVSSSFSAASLKDIFPSMKLPPELDRVGHITFTGKYDGYPNDFVAYGTFGTQLGNVTLDLNLNTVEGLAKGKYSGIVGLNNFDIGTLTGIKDLGRVTMSGRVIDGRGLTTSTMVADLTGQLTMLEYKGYTYHNARIDGQLTGKLFNGTLDINDPNIDMHFEGVADFRDSIPHLDFVAKVDSIRFQQLGFSKEPFYVEGYFDVDMTTGKISQLNGTLEGENVRIISKDKTYTLDSLYLVADVDTITQDRYYNIKSDVVSGTIRGSFDPLKLASQVQQYLSEQYPSAIDPPTKQVTTTGPQHVSWDLTVHDSKHWFALAGIEDLELKNAHTAGSLDLDQQLVSGSMDLA
jgi:hypothetical protein